MCAQFIHSALGEKGGGVHLVCEGTYGLAWGVVFDGRKDRGFVCVSLFFNAGGSVCGHVCVNTHTHTLAAQTGYSDESPGIGMRYLEGLKNPDGLNLGIYVFVYVYKADTAPAAAGVACPEGSGDSTQVYIYAKRREEILD